MPCNFLDSAGREWMLTVDPISIGQVRRKHDLDLPALDASAALRIWDDLVLGCDVAWTLCQAQATDSGVSEADFQSQNTGDAIGRFQAALLSAIGDFLPPKKRKIFLRAAEEGERARLQAFARAIERFDDPAAESQRLAAIDAAIDGALSSIYALPAK